MEYFDLQPRNREYTVLKWQLIFLVIIASVLVFYVSSLVISLYFLYRYVPSQLLILDSFIKNVNTSVTIIEPKLLELLNRLLNDTRL